jgi:O-antigen ligase
MASALAARSAGEAWLDRGARFLVVALPVLFLIGRAPADVAVSLIALLLLARSALERDWAWLRTPWVMVGLAIWLYLVLVSALAADAAGAYSRALPFGRFVLFAAALQHWLLVDRGTRRAMLIALAAVIAFVLLDSLLQFATGRDVLGHTYEAERLTGPFDDTVPGSFMIKTWFPVLGLALALAAPWHRRWREALAIGLIIFMALTVTLTGERIALVMLGIGLLPFMLLLRELRLPLLFAGVAALGLIGGAIAVSPDLKTRLVRHTTHDLTDFWDRRYGELFRRSVRIWQGQPVIGIGLRNFRHRCANQHFEHIGPVEDRCYTHPHQIYLEWLVEAGAVGLLGFLAMIWLWGRDLMQGLRMTEAEDYPIAIGALTAILVFLWPLRSSMSFFSNWNAILFWLMLGLALAVCAPQGAVRRRGGERFPA